MFRRRNRQAEDSPEAEATVDEETTEEAATEEAAEESGTSAGKAPGPWDSGDKNIPERERVDFGGILVPMEEDLEIQVNLEATEVDEEGNPVDGHIAAITVMNEESGLQLQAFAAPKVAGIWDEVRKETSEEIKQAGGDTREVDGPFGTELHAMVPVDIPEEMLDQVPDEVKEQGYVFQPIRFLGVDGPRWFLRGLIQGAAFENEEQAAILEGIFGDIVVVRGDDPMPPHDPLALTLPAEAEQALAEAEEDEDERPPLNPFERGPEITEVR